MYIVPPATVVFVTYLWKSSPPFQANYAMGVNRSCYGIGDGDVLLAGRAVELLGNEKYLRDPGQIAVTGTGH